MWTGGGKIAQGVIFLLKHVHSHTLISLSVSFISSEEPLCLNNDIFSTPQCFETKSRIIWHSKIAGLARLDLVLGNWSVSMTGGPYHWEFTISLGYPCQIKIHTRVPTTIICIVSYNSGFSKECLWVFGKFEFTFKSYFRLAYTRVDPTVLSKMQWNRDKSA